MELKRDQWEETLRVARDHLDRVLEAQKSQAGAIAHLAGSVEKRDSTEGYEHKEMRIALRAIHRDIQLMLSGSKTEI